jgi:hypothetical protein
MTLTKAADAFLAAAILFALAFILDLSRIPTGRIRHTTLRAFCVSFSLLLTQKEIIVSKAGSATAKERSTTYKDYHYCGKNFTFPAEDREDLRNAVTRLSTTNQDTGPAKACLNRRANEIEAGDAIPDTWKSSAKMSTAR